MFFFRVKILRSGRYLCCFENQIFYMNDGSIDKEKEECKKLKWNKLWMKKNVTVGKSRTEACLHIRFNITKD